MPAPQSSAPRDTACRRGPDSCILIITHYKRLLDFVKPDKVFVMAEGKIVAEEDGDFISHIEEKGYDWLKKNDAS